MSLPIPIVSLPVRQLYQPVKWYTDRNIINDGIFRLLCCLLLLTEVLTLPSVEVVDALFLSIPILAVVSGRAQRDDCRFGRRPASPGTSLTLIGSRPRRMKAHRRWPRRLEWGLLRRMTRALLVDYDVEKGTGAFPPRGHYIKAAVR